MEQINVYLLEDETPHIEEMQTLLTTIVGQSVPTCTNIRIALVKNERPQARNPNYTGAFTAPLKLSREQYTWIIGHKTDEIWRFTKEAPYGDLQIVPWRTKADSRYFMPHLVILDMYTPGGSENDAHATLHNYETTIALFEGCGYPSDMVWTLSQKAGENREYGHFFPKPFLEDISEYKIKLESALQAILKKHTATSITNSYLESDVADLYGDVLIPRSWANNIKITVDCVGVDVDTLKTLWSSATTNSAYHWRIVDEPGEESLQGGVFTFFRQDIGLIKQASYVTGEWYGLPSEYLWATVPDIGFIYRQPEEVLRNAVVKLKDRSVNLLLTRNLFILSRMLIGYQNTFNHLNHAMPDVAVSAASINRMKDYMFEDMTPEDWFQSRFLGQKGQPAIT
jgi:hypothetical protein